MYKSFQDIQFVKRLVSKFPNKNVLDYFLKVQEEELIELFRRDKAKVVEKEDKYFCSVCNYKFGIDAKTGDNESEYHYCVGCLTTLLCCDNMLCDADTERLQEEINNTMNCFYDNSHKIAS